MAFNLIYWTHMGGKYVLLGFSFGKMWKMWERMHIWPDWGNTTWVDMAGYGRIGVYRVKKRMAC